ncbi:MAG: hypothetical protein HY591_03585 [Candidatus Omnitrophica bacterium]|nr:hypothetical protein [Candidatus Omnitrophota bacterium]
MPHQRVCVPAEQAEHADHPVQPPFLGSLPKQSCVPEPGQSAPPQPGAGFVQSRVCVPGSSQAVAGHADHPLQPPFLGSLPRQSCVPGPSQPAPPQGTGLVHVRACVPSSPQTLAEHAVHALQPPSTAGKHVSPPTK